MGDDELDNKESVIDESEEEIGTWEYVALSVLGDIASDVKTYDVNIRMQAAEAMLGYLAKLLTN